MSFPCVSHRIIPALVALALTSCCEALSGQTGEEAVPCPPSFPSLYQNANLDYITFWGRSRLMMRQPDGSYGYHCVGESTDGNWKVSGNHYVASRQCLDAAYSYWAETPAWIVRLWNEQLYYIGSDGSGGCGGGEGGGGGEYITSDDELLYSSSYDPYAPEPPCGGGGGTGGGGVPGLACSYDYVTLEISRDRGQTWEVWWAGWTLVCVQAA